MPFSRGSFWPRDTTQVPALWADSLQFELLAFDISINVPAATSSCLLPMVCLMSLICYGHRNQISHFISLWCNIRLSRLQVSQRLSNVAKGHGFVAGFKRNNMTLFFGLLVILIYIPDWDFWIGDPCITDFLFYTFLFLLRECEIDNSIYP